MRIDSGVRPPYVVRISGESAAPAARTAQAPRAPNTFDRVEISPQSRELDRLKRELAALPDVRPERVALAKQQLQYGPYRVDPALIARKMMQEQPLQGDDL